MRPKRWPVSGRKVTLLDPKGRGTYPIRPFSSGFAVNTIPVRLLGQSNALPLCIVRSDLRGCAEASGRKALVPILRLQGLGSGQVLIRLFTHRLR